MDAPPDPTPPISRVPEQQETPSPGVSGKLSLSRPVLLSQTWGRRTTEERRSIPRRAALFSDKRWTRWGLLISERKRVRGMREKQPSDKQNCKGRWAASVPEVSWNRVSKACKGTSFWERFLIGLWRLTAAGCFRPKNPKILNQSGEGSNVYMINKACNFWWGCSLPLHEPVWISNGMLGSFLDALLKHWILHSCKQDTGASWS